MSPPAPPARALELVKQEVHRALQAFSAQPLKGESRPPLPADLLRPFDVTKDGMVTYPEFKAGLRGLGLGLTDDEANSLAREVDGRGTGLVERQRFEIAAMEDWSTRTDEASSTKRCQRDDEAFSQGKESVRGGVHKPDEHEEQVDEVSVRVHAQRISRSGADTDNRCTMFHGNAVSYCTDHNDGSNEPSRDAGKEPSRKDVVTDLPPPDMPRPPPPLAKQQQLNTRLNTSDQVRSPTFSFDDWRRITGGRDNCSDTAASRIGMHAARAQLVDRQSSNRPQQCQPLHTLRCLLERGLFDSTDRVRRRRLTARRDQERRLQPHDDEKCLEGRRDDDDGQNQKRDRGRSRSCVDRRSVRPTSAPVGARDGEYHQGKAMVRGNDRTSTMRPDQETRLADADHAENILRARSRGDLVGLRRALSRADPSASGVVSQRELERVILRRFGAGLGHDEARELGARYRRDLSGRSMVDYSRLVDALEVDDAGISGAVVGQQLLQSKGKKKQRIRLQRETAGQALGRENGDRLMKAGKCRKSIGDAPAEESQLVRRARSKTIALLDTHGSRRVDKVFQLVDPGEVICGV